MSLDNLKIVANDRVMIVGITGSGKSFLMRSLIKRYLPFYRVVVYDSQRQHGDLRWTHPNLTIYQPLDPDSISEFEKMCRAIYKTRNVVFCIENIDFYSTPQKPQSRAFKKIIHWGRMRGIGVIMTSRRIADVHKSPCSQVAHWFIFYTFLPNDTKYLRQFIGNVADQAKILKQYQFIYWTIGNKVKICNPIREEKQIEHTNVST